MSWVSGWPPAAASSAGPSHPSPAWSLRYNSLRPGNKLMLLLFEHLHVTVRSQHMKIRCKVDQQTLLGIPCRETSSAHRTGISHYRLYIGCRDCCRHTGGDVRVKYTKACLSNRPWIFFNRHLSHALHTRFRAFESEASNDDLDEGEGWSDNMLGDQYGKGVRNERWRAAGEREQAAGI